MDKASADSVVAQFRSAFPDGAFTQIDVLGYGDDPDPAFLYFLDESFVLRADKDGARFEAKRIAADKRYPSNRS